MSGHSKWHNIQKTKGAQDAKRAAAFTKIAKELIVAVKEGGSADPAYNSRLATVITKAKAANMPNDNIKRCLEKAAGAGGDNYETITYEGYGPGGVAVMVETLTDNRNRTAGDLRHYFDKNGGNLGQPGSVMFMFNRTGMLRIVAEGLSEDAVMEDALDAGASDFNSDGEIFEISTEPNDLGKVRDSLDAKGYSFVSAEVEYIPTTGASIADEDNISKMQRLIDMLEENDDIQAVWHNWENVPE